MSKRITDDEIDDAALHEYAEREAAKSPGEPDSDAWAQQLVATYQEKVAAARRALLPQAVPIARAPSPSPALAALSREALLARIAQLTPQGAGLRYRDLGEQSDDDMRQILATLESPTTREP